MIAAGKDNKKDNQDLNQDLIMKAYSSKNKKKDQSTAKQESYKTSGKLKPVREEPSRSPRDVPYRRKYEKMVIKLLAETNKKEQQ